MHCRSQLLVRRLSAGSGYGIEIDPAYCDVTIRRLYAVCGLDAVLDATGKPFTEIEAHRKGGGGPPPVDARQGWRTQLGGKVQMTIAELSQPLLREVLRFVFKPAGCE